MHMKIIKNGRNQKDTERVNRGAEMYKKWMDEKVRINLRDLKSPYKINWKIMKKYSKNI